MSISKLIKQHPEVRRLFGQQELKIIEKQVLGIQLTPSETTRLSRDIRPKFKAIRLLSGIREEDLKKGSEIKERIKEAKKTIVNTLYYPHIKKIILFGSTVENQRTLRSDIDIAVEFDDMSVQEATKFRIEVNYDEKVDIQVYNVLPDKIKKEIDEKGKVLYERKNK